jgi:hypothetical protein
MITINPIKIESEHFVAVDMDGEVKQYGPFPTDNEAAIMAAEFAAACRCLNQAVQVQAAASHKR